MTLLSPHYLQIDGEQLATYAKGLELVDGLDTLPGRRIRGQPAAYQDGDYPTTDDQSFLQAKTQRVRIWVSPFDANGNTTYAKGGEAHLRENLDDILRILGGKTHADRTVDWIVPTPTATRTLRANGQIRTGLEAGGSSRLVRRLPITITYPWPVFKDVTTGEQTLGPFTGAQTFTPGGTAPQIGAKYTCTAAGRITHDETGWFWEVTSLPGGATSVIIRTEPPRSILTDTGADARHVYNSNVPWLPRFSAGELANLTITGTWQIDHFDLYH